MGHLEQLLMEEMLAADQEADEYDDVDEGSQPGECQWHLPHFLFC